MISYGRVRTIQDQDGGADGLPVTLSAGQVIGVGKHEMLPDEARMLIRLLQLALRDQAAMQADSI